METIRTKPRHHETISLRGRTKWRLDALCEAGRRTRTQTIELLMDYYLRGHPVLRDIVDDLANAPHPNRWTRRKPDASHPDPGRDGTTEETTT